VLTRLVRELGMLAGALGVELTDESVLPVATLCRSSEEDAIDTVLRVGREFRSNAPQHRMSSLQDLEAGRPLEIEETLGYSLRKATQLKVPAPLLDSFYNLVAAIDRTRREPEQGSP